MGILDDITVQMHPAESSDTIRKADKAGLAIALEYWEDALNKLNAEAKKENHT